MKYAPSFYFRHFHLETLPNFLQMLNPCQFEIENHHRVHGQMKSVIGPCNGLLTDLYFAFLHLPNHLTIKFDNLI